LLFTILTNVYIILRKTSECVCQPNTSIAHTRGRRTHEARDHSQRRNGKHDANVACVTAPC